VLHIDILFDHFSNIHEKFCKIKEKTCENTVENNGIIFREEISLDKRNLEELEIYADVVEELLLEADVGKVYFFLNKKLHEIHKCIGKKYHTYGNGDEKKLFCFLDILSDDEFLHFVSVLKLLMSE